MDCWCGEMVLRIPIHAAISRVRITALSTSHRLCAGALGRRRVYRIADLSGVSPAPRSCEFLQICTSCVDEENFFMAFGPAEFGQPHSFSLSLIAPLTQSSEILVLATPYSPHEFSHGRHHQSLALPAPKSYSLRCSRPEARKQVLVAIKGCDIGLNI